MKDDTFGTGVPSGAPPSVRTILRGNARAQRAAGKIVSALDAARGESKDA